eukprot:356673-Chlamydomonas_euryale.AAC.6
MKQGAGARRETRGRRETGNKGPARVGKQGAGASPASHPSPDLPPATPPPTPHPPDLALTPTHPPAFLPDLQAAARAKSKAMIVARNAGLPLPSADEVKVWAHACWRAWAGGAWASGLSYTPTGSRCGPVHAGGYGLAGHRRRGSARCPQPYMDSDTASGVCGGPCLRGVPGLKGHQRKRLGVEGPDKVGRVWGCGGTQEGAAGCGKEERRGAGREEWRGVGREKQRGVGRQERWGSAGRSGGVRAGRSGGVWAGRRGGEVQGGAAGWAEAGKGVPP